jgi:hypothetical protein
VVVRDVLDPRRLSTIRRGAEMAVREMVGRDEMRVGIARVPTAALSFPKKEAPSLV